MKDTVRRRGKKYRLGINICKATETPIHCWWECKSGTATFRDSLTVSYKTRHSLIVLFSNCVPRYLSNWFQNLCPHRNLHMNTYRSVIHKCPKQETTKMSFNRWVDKLWYIQTMECYLVVKEMSYQVTEIWWIVNKSC